jgi:C-terminal processing protease CtpA/Prc
MSANISTQLPDGALVVVTNAHILDGTGERLPAAPMRPDVNVAAGGNATEQAAAKWLRNQCADGSSR